MGQAYILFLFVIIISTNSTKSTRTLKRYCFICFFVLGCMIMFRSFRVGNDTRGYINLFTRFSALDSVSSYAGRYEIGFILLCKGLSLISSNPQVLLIFSGLIVAVSFGRFIYKYSSAPMISVVMFIALQFLDLSMSGVRQIIAVSLLVISFDFIVNRKLIYFVILVLLATSIHASAIVFLVLYPLSNFECNIRFLRTSVIAMIIGYFLFEYVIRIVSRFFPVYEKYFISSGKSFSIEPKLATILTLLFWVILFSISYRINRRNNANNLTDENQNTPERRLRNIEGICIVLSLGMLLWSLNGTILNRFKYIFSFPLLVYYPNAIVKLKVDSRRIMVVGSIIVFIAYITIIYTFRPEWQSTFPYYTFWQ